MDAKTRKNFWVGLLFLAGIGLIIASGLFLSGSYIQPYRFVETYFPESVAGINPGKSVAFNGIRRGRVQEVMLVGEAYPTVADTTAGKEFEYYIMVRIALDRDSFPIPHPLSGKDKATLQDMIHQGLRLQYSSEFLGSLDFVFVDPEEAPAQDFPWTSQHFYIPSRAKPSKDITQQALNLLEELEEKLTPVLENLDKITEDIPRVVQKLDVTIEHVNAVFGEQQDNIEQTIENVRLTSEQLKQLAEKAKASPSQTILGAPPPKSRFDRSKR